MVGSGSYEYRISLFGENGESLDGVINATLDLPCKAPDPERLIVYYYSADVKKQINYTASETNVRFKALSGVKYYAACEYKIGLVPCEILSLSVDKGVASYGSTVFVSYVMQKGIRVNGTYYVTESGEKVYFENYFTLTGDVSVGIDYRYVEYTVSFVSDGKVISSDTYHYGDVPIAPLDPKKPSDQSYSYSFIGWSEEITAVSGDKVYEARYWSSPIIKEEEKVIQISDSLLRWIVLLISLSFIFLFGGVPCIILSIVLSLKRKKARQNDKNEKRTL